MYIVCPYSEEDKPLLLAERAISRDYLVKMWSSKMLYLTASRAEGHYSGLMHGLE